VSFFALKLKYFHANGWATVMEETMSAPGIILHFEGNTYELILSSYSWHQAHSVAQNSGGYLAQITSEGENAAVHALAMAHYDYQEKWYSAPDGGNSVYIWLGGSDLAQEGTWRWSDGSLIAGYQNWGEGDGVTEPDNYGGTQHYLGMALEQWPYETGSIGASGEWNDISGVNGLWSVIEFDGLIGTAGSDRIVGSNIDEYFYGGNRNDKLYGYAGNDELNGGSGNDSLYGGAGNDELYGDAGADSLNGGLGKDTMFGGAGADTFVFTLSKDSSAKGSRADIIKDFEQGFDLIDLSAIDASTKLRGNNEFTFDGTSSFGRSKQGDIYYKQFDQAGTTNDYTMVFIDTDNDRGTEMSIKLMGLHDLTASDFIL
jgi:Ca2+-binding RTX toxin-like protein